MDDRKKLVITFSVIFVVITLALRILKLVPNFMPMGALALWCGIYLRTKWSFFIPLLLMVVSDMIIGWHSLVFFTWGCILLYQLFGWLAGKNKKTLKIVAGSLAGSISFFLVTNFAVWAFTPLYAKTAAGLVQCFYMALPFFRNTIAGDLFYTGAFVGIFELAVVLAGVKKQAMVRVKAI